MAKKEAQIEKVGEILAKSIQRTDLSRRLKEYGVWPIWNEVVGPTIARNAQPEKIRQGTLFVKVPSPMWMQQLQYMKEMVRERLNQNLGSEVVKNIFFFVGKVDTAPSAPAEQRRGATPSPPDSKLAEEDLRSVKDPEIRRALRRLFAAHSRQGKKDP